MVVDSFRHDLPEPGVFACTYLACDSSYYVFHSKALGGLRSDCPTADMRMSFNCKPDWKSFPFLKNYCEHYSLPTKQKSFATLPVVHKNGHILASNKVGG